MPLFCFLALFMLCNLWLAIPGFFLILLGLASCGDKAAGSGPAYTALAGIGLFLLSVVV